MRSKLFILLMFLPLSLFAQETVNLTEGIVKADSSFEAYPWTFEMMPLFNPWLASTNPAGHQFNPEILPGRLDLNYRSGNGDYKEALHGDKMQHYNFRTEKYKRIKQTSFYGYFSYDKSFENNVVFSEVNDPYRGTPYLLIDTMDYGDLIDREFFQLQGDISTPLSRNLYWGFSANMDVGLAAQDRDPRSKNKVMNLALSQGLLLDLPFMSLGLNGLYSYYNEDIEVDIIKQNTQLTFLQLHGFDTYTYHVAGSFYRLYKRKSYGGEGQLNFSPGPLNALVGGKFLYIDETADDGRKAGDASWSYMKNDSDLEGNEIRLYSVLGMKTPHTLQALNASYTLRYMVGAEIIQRLEQVGEKGAVDWVDYGEEEKYASNNVDIDLDYAFVWMKDETRKSFEIKLGMNYRESEQSYYLPDMSISYANRFLSARMGKSFYYRQHELTIGASMIWKKNLDYAGDFDLSSVISQKLLVPEVAYFTSDYMAPGLDLSYSASLNRIFERFYLNSGIKWYNGQTNYYSLPGEERIMMNISTGVIF